MRTEDPAGQGVAAGSDYGAVLLSPEGIRDPYGLYKVLRRDAPVHWSEALEMWMVTAHDDVREVYRDHENFSSVGRNAANVQRLSTDTLEQLPMLRIAETTPALDSADPPVHTNQRVQVMASLTPRRLAARHDDFVAECDRLADALTRETEPDVIEHFSAPLAYRTILGLFGAPPELAPLYDEIAKAKADFTALGGSDLDAAWRYEHALESFRLALEAIYATNRERERGITVISALLNPADRHTRLSDDELFAILKTFFAAALDNLIVTVPMTLLALLQHPEQCELVRGDPELAVAAYEETVRWNVPAHANRRVAAYDVPLGDTVIRKGERVLVFKASANHDPSVWHEPERFDMLRERPPNATSMSFGLGIHFCSGAGLARLVGPIAVQTLLQRFPAMELVDGWSPSWRSVPATRLLTALPLRLGEPEASA